MLYRKYFDGNDTQGQRQFFDSIAPQVTRRTMSADEKGLFVEYEVTGEKIVTTYVYPPIPIRDFDWCAMREGNDECGPFGWNKTEPGAIADLLELESDSGQLSSAWLLPLAVASVALYALYFMASHGVFQALTFLQK